MVRRKEARQCVSTQTRFGLMRLASLPMMCEARRTAASPQGEAVAKPVCPEAMLADRSAWGDWRRNVWKLMHDEPRRPAVVPERAEQESESQ